MDTNKVFYDHDIVIIGNGTIGAALALALSFAGFRVQVVDALSTEGTVIPDLRVSAVSYTSVNLLRRLGVWQRIGEKFCAPYRRLETWEHSFSKVIFDAASLNLSELGFMVENQRLRRALQQALKDCKSLMLHCPVSLNKMIYCRDHWELTLDNGHVIKSRLVVGADGTHSWVRKHVGIAVSGWQYRQACLLLDVELENDQKYDITWQEFHPSGPRAFLPLHSKKASLVWYDNMTRIRQLEMLSLSALKGETKSAFPSCLGQFTLHRTASFSLTQHHVCDYVRPGLVLIGDAAHTINPLAGQGANLGFRDIQALTEVLTNARRENRSSWYSLETLKRYQQRRFKDNLIMQTAVDALYITFSNDVLPLMVIRNLGLMLIQRADWIKKKILRYALGL